MMPVRSQSRCASTAKSTLSPGRTRRKSGMASRRSETTASLCLGLGVPAVLTAIDVAYVSRRTIRRIYLVDAEQRAAVASTLRYLATRWWMQEASEILRDWSI